MPANRTTGVCNDQDGAARNGQIGIPVQQILQTEKLLMIKESGGIIEPESESSCNFQQMRYHIGDRGTMKVDMLTDSS